MSSVVSRQVVLLIALGVVGNVSAEPECGWAADIRAAQYADLQLVTSAVVRGNPIGEPSFYVGRRLKELGIDVNAVIGYRDGDLSRKPLDERALFGTLCLLRFKDPVSGESLARYDCPDDSKLVNLQAACDGFSLCQTIACVPRAP